jgi:hypothetical protein
MPPLTKGMVLFLRFAYAPILNLFNDLQSERYFENRYSFHPETAPCPIPGFSLLLPEFIDKFFGIELRFLEHDRRVPHKVHFHYKIVQLL